MSDPYLLRIKEIADLRGRFRAWKVHLLGGLSLHPRTGEMLVDVCLVPMKNPAILRSKDSRTLVENRHYDFGEQRIVSIGVGQLPLLSIGRIFIDGLPNVRPEYITAKFTFTVTENNQQFIPTKQGRGKWNGKSCYWIPSTQYKVFFGDSKRNPGTRPSDPFPGRYLVVNFLSHERPRIPADTYPLNRPGWLSHGNRETIRQPKEVYGLIIPTFEMIRFYYTHSTQSYREILSDGLGGVPNRMFRPEQTIRPEPDGNGGFLMLSKYVTNDDWRVLLRPAFDDYALSQARHIYISSLNNKKGEDNAFLPEAGFPFRNQKTSLTVHGTYVQSGNRTYFLVFWLERCTAPFPYKNAGFWRENPGVKSAPETISDVEQSTNDDSECELLGERQTEEGSGTRHTTVRSSEGTELQSDDIPSAVRAKLKILLGEESRFPYLDDHPLEEKQPSLITFEGNPGKPFTPIYSGISEPMETGSTAPESGTRPVTSVTILPDGEIPPSRPSLEKWKNIREANIPNPKPPPKPPRVPEDAGVSMEGNSDVANASSDSGKTKLAIDINVFQEILTRISEYNLEARMIYLPQNGEVRTAIEASPFPQPDYAGRPADPVFDERHLPAELFISEIRSADNRYAYLFDIEAKKTKTGERSRSFRMYLCFEGSTYEKLGGERLRTILRTCQRNGGRWVIPTTIAPDNPKITDFGRESLIHYVFKHNLDSCEEYASRIVATLKARLWLENTETSNQDVTGQEI